MSGRLPENVQFIGDKRQMLDKQQLSFQFYTPPETIARPFLKWAGGKTQLLGKITECLPTELSEDAIDSYIEPFIGGGATFFYIIQNYAINKSYISDRNEELVLAYRTIQQRVGDLIDLLQSIERDYFCKSPQEQKSFFYQVRSEFNQERSAINFASTDSESVRRTAQLIFLNRTCFNGLFRVNSSGGFNVPFGSYQNPMICDAENLRAVSRVLQQTQICHGDFESCEQHVNSTSFVYFDPPYRPISRTASFNSYSMQIFDDAEQERLAGFFRKLDEKGAKLMLSNSDPHNEDSGDDFFIDLFSGFNVQKVLAKRNINSNGSRRGEITELLITNYAS